MTPNRKPPSATLTSSLEQLQVIVKWFESQTEIDVEVGLLKAREGAVLIKGLKARLREVENEFQEVKKELDSEKED